MRCQAVSENPPFAFDDFAYAPSWTCLQGEPLRSYLRLLGAVGVAGRCSTSLSGPQLRALAGILGETTMDSLLQGPAGHLAPIAAPAFEEGLAIALERLGAALARKGLPESSSLAALLRPVDAVSLPELADTSYATIAITIADDLFVTRTDA